MDVRLEHAALELKPTFITSATENRVRIVNNGDVIVCDRTNHCLFTCVVKVQVQNVCHRTCRAGISRKASEKSA